MRNAMVGQTNVALLVLTALAVVIPGAPVSVSIADEERAIARILQFIQENPNNPPNSQIDHPAAKLVRLAFHDCMVKCDGCLNMNNVDNTGLGPMYDVLNNIYDTEGYGAAGMSRADFIALAGITAVGQAASQQDCMMMGMPQNCTPPSPTLTPRYGRQDCATSPNTDEVIQFPNPHGDLDHVMSVFGIEGMGLTQRQVVALLGAHSLGDANPQNSGFVGPWAPPPDVLSNGFFRQLVNATTGGWFQAMVNSPQSPVAPTPRYQWVTANITMMGGPPGMMGGPPGIMMLNTDMCLYRQIQPNEDGSESNAACGSNVENCQLAVTSNYVQEFAMNNTAWHEAFGPAFQTLIENGYEANNLVEATSPTLDASPTPSPTPSGASTNKALLFITAAVVIFASLISTI